MPRVYAYTYGRDSIPCRRYIPIKNNNTTYCVWLVHTTIYCDAAILRCFISAAPGHQAVRSSARRRSRSAAPGHQAVRSSARRADIPAYMQKYTIKNYFQKVLMIIKNKKIKNGLSMRFLTLCKIYKTIKVIHKFKKNIKNFHYLF